MYTRKPKNIVSKVIDLTTGLQAKEASHTWMGEDKTRTARFGSTSRETFAQRRQTDRSRMTVGRYSDSSIANGSTAARGDLSRAARSQREKINQRFTSPDETTKDISNPLPPQEPSSPAPTNTPFYPEFRPKL
ncbi:hypothetical protein A3F64_02880 [Candidatus Saccharibacteria bacterium RIFCSPHIGHO2_12_FULL_42_8]|nr:MAG: hypothetical protein A3F64_02880 [Candidatus Saccharibacteria bacterium RIFCSPHIGHO2_12_FULL_42_8]